MAYPIVDGTAPDADVQIDCPGARRLTIQVSNQAVYLTFGTSEAPGRPPVFDENPEPYQPVTGEIVRDFDALKYRAYTPAASLPAGSTQAYVRLIPRV